MILSYLVIGVLAVFGVIGFWRGWLREVATLAGLLVSWMLLITLGETFIGLVNRLFLMAAFTLRGGFDARDPSLLLRELRQRPLVDPRHPDLFLGLLVLLLAAAAFAAANRLVARASGWSAQGLGALVGVANGYLIAYLSLHYLAPAQPAGLAPGVNAWSVAETLGQYLPTVLLVGVGLAVVIALISSRRLSGRSSPRPARSKG